MRAALNLQKSPDFHDIERSLHRLENRSDDWDIEREISRKTLLQLPTTAPSRSSSDSENIYVHAVQFVTIRWHCRSSSVSRRNISFGPNYPTDNHFGDRSTNDAVSWDEISDDCSATMNLISCDESEIISWLPERFVCREGEKDWRLFVCVLGLWIPNQLQFRHDLHCSSEFALCHRCGEQRNLLANPSIGCFNSSPRLEFTET
jgi:hypothetical protein